MDLFIALGIFGALLFWVFIITNKPAEPTFIENQTKTRRRSAARLSNQRAGDQHQPESKTAPMKLGGDVAAPLKTTGYAAGRGQPMPEGASRDPESECGSDEPLRFTRTGTGAAARRAGDPDGAGPQERAAAEAAHTVADTTRVLSLLRSQSPEWIKL